MKQLLFVSLLFFFYSVNAQSIKDSTKKLAPGDVVNISDHKPKVKYYALIMPEAAWQELFEWIDTNGEHDGATCKKYKIFLNQHLREATNDNIKIDSTGKK